MSTTDNDKGVFWLKGTLNSGEDKILNGRVSRVSTMPARRSWGCQRVLGRRFGGMRKGVKLANWTYGPSGRRRSYVFCFNKGLESIGWSACWTEEGSRDSAQAGWTPRGAWKRGKGERGKRESEGGIRCGKIALVDVVVSAVSVVSVVSVVSLVGMGVGWAGAEICVCVCRGWWWWRQWRQWKWKVEGGRANSRVLWKGSRMITSWDLGESKITYRVITYWSNYLQNDGRHIGFV